MSTSQMKVVISGAGLIGLLTAQALKARNIDFVIFDRDESAQFREIAGWAITLHWAIGAFESLLPPGMMDDIYACQVRPNFHESDSGNFKYINAGTGETILSIPPSRRLRVRREQVRRVLMKDIDVQWDCKLSDIEFGGDKVKVHCANGRTFVGDVLFGCEGSNSATRRIICPDNGQLYQLPIRFCGAKVRMTEEECDKLAQQFDPLLFQGTTPGSNTFFWFSMLSTPEYSGQDGVFYSQVNLSWNVPTDRDEPFDSQEEKARAMQTHAEGISPDLKWLVDRALENVESLQEIKLCDWPEVMWDTKDGRVLLAGDAAHAMTMYRGEAANHGITDVFDLVKQVDLYVEGRKNWAQATQDYVEAVNTRAAPAVLLSRQACIDAHDFSKIYATSESPLLSSRKKSK